MNLLLHPPAADPRVGGGSAAQGGGGGGRGAATQEIQQVVALLGAVVHVVVIVHVGQLLIVRVQKLVELAVGEAAPRQLARQLERELVVLAVALARVGLLAGGHLGPVEDVRHARPVADVAVVRGGVARVGVAPGLVQRLDVRHQPPQRQEALRERVQDPEGGVRRRRAGEHLPQVPGGTHRAQQGLKELVLGGRAPVGLQAGVGPPAQLLGVGQVRGGLQVAEQAERVHELEGRQPLPLVDLRGARGRALLPAGAGLRVPQVARAPEDLHDQRHVGAQVLFHGKFLVRGRPLAPNAQVYRAVGLSVELFINFCY
mmetsp:Transcript_23289/g.36720  ORF Transcript_23289/g.36720 Transcript_23289/m.36720 type:complete len:315 (+) Transcript_23289:411-1355(+)